MAVLWSEDLSGGVAEIAEQHRALFGQVDRLLAACRQGQGEAAATGSSTRRSSSVGAS